MADRAECGACGPGFPCADGMVCNVDSNTCEEAMAGLCNQDLDCREPGLRVCFGGECIPCLQDNDCGPRARCENMGCIDDLCAGVECQIGSACDAGTGRCDPGCNADADCPAAEQACNVETGQCWFRDLFWQGCDLGGGEGVCAPGGECIPPFLPIRMNGGICTCEKEDPADPNSADRIPCHPGGTCVAEFQGELLPQPVCSIAPF